MVADPRANAPNDPYRPGPLPCPKCGRLLECEGELTFGCSSAVFYSYSCDVCLDPSKVGDKVFECAYTFATDAEGNVVCLNGKWDL